MSGEVMGFSIDAWSAIGSVVSGLGGLAGFTALAIETWTRRQGKRLAPAELLPLLLTLRADLNNVTSSGGTPWAWFIEPERRGRESELAAWHAMVNDNKLNQLVANARSAMNEAGARAQSAWNPAAIQAQSDAAREGVSSIDKAITRLAELTRKYG
ncbi:hypothetical protein [Streptomyces massasporeus]|uniref:hypothetical protein n=1 Tax=Streptomyces massasporeus TaxID=67324 RepID=UPI00370287AC